MADRQMAGDRDTRVTLTLTEFGYSELTELAELLGTTGSKLGAAAIEQWIQSPTFANLIKRARERRKAQGVDLGVDLGIGQQ
jgi:hypothetical protein